VVANGAERSQETLGVLAGFEALEHPFPLARRQVRVFSPIIQPFVLTTPFGAFVLTANDIEQEVIHP